MKNKGVTLIEIIIVLAIIGILLTTALTVAKDKPNTRQPRVVQVADPLPVVDKPSLTEECINGFAFIRGEGTVIQKQGSDGLPASC